MRITIPGRFPVYCCTECGYNYQKIFIFKRVDIMPVYLFTLRNGEESAIALDKKVYKDLNTELELKILDKWKQL